VLLFSVFGLHLICLDIDECLSFACGRGLRDNCINFPGYYKCTACGQGVLPDIMNDGCVGM
jgi:hypothetical protein